MPIHDPPRPCVPCRTKGIADPTCSNCHGTGDHVLIVCPYTIIKDVAWEVIAAAELAEKGSWPMAGGWLDQVHSLREAVRFVWRWRAATKE